MHRRHLLLGSAATLALPGLSSAATRSSFVHAEASVASLSQAMAAGKLTSERLVQDYLARIAALDKAGPRLNSVIELNPEARQIARALDAERKAGKLRGPLHGIPVLLKDNIATGDQMHTTAGSLALADLRVSRDAHLVQRLRAAGAVILGKTNLSEWANIRSTRSVSGWSGRGGLTRNPYALDRSTSGSSSGTGAAIAADLATLGVGTETDGSIVSPASICGLVGLKPTMGRVSRDGVIPIAHSQDTAGPMTRSVADAALLYAAMCGPDAADAVTQGAPTAAGRLDPASLKGARLGVARNYFTGFDEADAVIEAAIAKLRELGAEIVDNIELAPVGYGDPELSVLLYELKADLAQWLKTFAPGHKMQTLADVIAFNKAHRDKEMGWFGQELFEKAEALGDLSAPAYREALAACGKGAREEGLDKAIKAHRLDALIAPTGGPAWLIDPVASDHYGASFSTPAAVAGYPHLTVPAGFVRGLPLGLSFVGPAWSEWKLLSYGQAFEQSTRHRRPPGFVKKTVP
ncbi:amidase [Pelomonas sp. SE-A7]|uniref:amidase n=1 Tax=Pelomonas sp. SE-A7 TaxID=3054953 RepID=UPI00259CB764|nr:amidase [Pelomonas sp. SE-A7]MDM4767335.1 amidase [Pelomonas sp. SE-A7]